MVERHSLEPTYTKNNGLWLLNLNKLGVPGDFIVAEQNIVSIPAGEFGGNHKHPRSEAFIGIGQSLELIWQDETGKNHVENMTDGNALQLFVVHSLTPHVVVNRGNYPALLVELADAAQHDVEAVNLLGP